MEGDQKEGFALCYMVQECASYRGATGRHANILFSSSSSLSLSLSHPPTPLPHSLPPLLHPLSSTPSPPPHLTSPPLPLPIPSPYPSPSPPIPLLLLCRNIARRRNCSIFFQRCLFIIKDVASFESRLKYYTEILCSP